jgi:hypothetical protein
MKNTMMALAAVLSLALGACAPTYPYGFIYDGTTTPHGMMRVNGDGANKGGAKSGESCTTGILGVAAWGDASVAAAKAAGGIKDVHSVEYKETNYLYVYREGCTVVHGE